MLDIGNTSILLPDIIIKDGQRIIPVVSQRLVLFSFLGFANIKVFQMLWCCLLSTSTAEILGLLLGLDDAKCVCR
eukprot:m.355232 g.355232  ORF g.355232 m.355232 type:complete len:75 (+) comp16597_c1_seq26:174-398(+)